MAGRSAARSAGVRPPALARQDGAAAGVARRGRLPTAQGRGSYGGRAHEAAGSTGAESLRTLPRARPCRALHICHQGRCRGEPRHDGQRARSVSLVRPHGLAPSGRAAAAAEAIDPGFEAVASRRSSGRGRSRTSPFARDGAEPD